MPPYNLVGGELEHEALLTRAHPFDGARPTRLDAQSTSERIFIRAAERVRLADLHPVNLRAAVRNRNVQVGKNRLDPLRLRPGRDLLGVENIATHVQRPRRCVLAPLATIT